MKNCGVRHLIGISLGIAWGLIYCVIFSNLPIIQRLELDIQDSLIRLHKPGLIPKEILIIKINQSEMSGYDLHNLSKLNILYTALVKKLFENNARIVVVNLPEQMKQYIDADARLELPFKELINQYSNRIVLATRPNNLPSGASALNIYNNLLPFNDESANYSMPPEKVISYFRYNRNPQNLNSPARRADLFSRFIYEEDPNPNLRHKVKSVATLSLEKFYRASGDKTGLENITKLQTLPPVQINFWGPAYTFPSISFQWQCSSFQIELDQCHSLLNFQSPQTLHNKLVLVDLIEGKASETYRERSPYGEMSVAEVEANFIASLMTRSFLIMALKGSDYMITILGLVCISIYTVERMNKQIIHSIYPRDIWFFLSLSGGYITLSLLLFCQGLILPLIVPILGWLVTDSGIIVYLMFRQSAQQRQRLAERQAVLFQARKLLHRVATDIHDGPLQELKLVMDDIELLGINQPSVLIAPLLDRLESTGLSLRNQLSNTRTIAEKLEISPELEFGLAQGIQQCLQKLLNSGELILEVKEFIQPLREPKTDSAWLDAREDIFRFFREAITNVIRHAQPPNGSANQVSIYLSQEGIQCQLVIENNGALEKSTMLDGAINNQNNSGYGTKLMSTIAAELSNGAWQRVPLEAGGMRVMLTWTMKTV